LSSLIAHGELNAALHEGDAVLLGPELGWVARYGGSWWVECEHGWLRVTDEDVARELGQVAARLAQRGTAAADDGSVDEA
jgi:hypothetical protein